MAEINLKSVPRKILGSRFTTVILVGLLILIVLFIYGKLGLWSSDEQKKLNVGQSVSVQLKFVIGGQGSHGAYQLAEPMAATIADNGNIYVCDTANNCIKVFDNAGKFLFKFGDTNTFYLPMDIKVYNKQVYVVDSKNSRIQLFDLNGKFIKTFAGPEVGRKIGAWIPAAICVSGDNVFITDVFFHRVVKFDLKGNIKGQFGKPGNKEGQLMYPNGVAADQSGLVFVADSNNGRIQVFTNGGVYKYVLKNAEKTNFGFNMPRGLGIDEKNNLFVTETFSHDIRVVTLKGQAVVSTDTFGGRGTAKTEFNFPNDVDFNKEMLCVADRANNRVAVYSIKY